MKLDQLQVELVLWSVHNFPGRPSYFPLLGAVEELGELAHAHLKGEQGIRTDVDHDVEAKDAIGDCIIYLADYCNARGWNMQQIVEETWEKVRQRDWRADPERGGEEEPEGKDITDFPCPQCDGMTVRHRDCLIDGPGEGAYCTECSWTHLDPSPVSMQPTEERADDDNPGE